MTVSSHDGCQSPTHPPTGASHAAYSTACASLALHAIVGSAVRSPWCRPCHRHTHSSADEHHRPSSATPRHRAVRCAAGADARVGHASSQVLRAGRGLPDQPAARRRITCPRCTASPLLNRSAQGWTNVMVSSDQFSHGANFASRISAVGLRLALGRREHRHRIRDAPSVVQGLDGQHRPLREHPEPGLPQHRHGVSTHPVKGYATGAGTWTQDFALGMHQSPPSGNAGPMDGCPY